MIFFCWRISHYLQSAKSIKVSPSGEIVRVSNVKKQDNQSGQSGSQSKRQASVSVSVNNSVNKTVSLITKQINKFSKLATQSVGLS